MKWTDIVEATVAIQAIYKVAAKPGRSEWLALLLGTMPILRYVYGATKDMPEGFKARI